MHVTKLRSAANANGLIPAGAYFAQIAAKLKETNARQAALQDDFDDEDHKLEAMHRKRSVARALDYPETYAMI